MSEYMGRDHFDDEEWDEEEEGDDIEESEEDRIEREQLGLSKRDFRLGKEMVDEAMQAYDESNDKPGFIKDVISLHDKIEETLRRDRNALDREKAMRRFIAILDRAPTDQRNIVSEGEFEEDKETITLIFDNEDIEIKRRLLRIDENDEIMVDEKVPTATVQIKKIIQERGEPKKIRVYIRHRCTPNAIRALPFGYDTLISEIFNYDELKETIEKKIIEEL
jgi:hypothetical protein